jgi:tRNA(Glu) U13 pseudouridine synthase TruD
MITGPIIGFNLLVAQSEAGKREKNLLKKRDISDKELKTFQQNKIFGLRRSLRVYPEPRMLKYQNDDILISFALPSGAYASIIIDKLLEK